MHEIRIVVLWHSLVVEAYRSFFHKLHRLTGWPLALIAPRRFRELGDQMVDCARFDTEPDGGVTGVTGVAVPALRLHLQAVLYPGLWRNLARLFGTGPEARVLLCVAEAYALTATWAWIAARLALGPRFVFLTCAMQNIDKPFGWAVRTILRFNLRRCDAILAIGQGQEEVLRCQGYRGPCIRFPLWFNGSLFAPEALAPQRAALLGEHPEIAACAEHVTIGYCGRMTPEKGVFDLLDVLATHLADLREDVAVVLAGAGAELARAQAACAALQRVGWQIVHLGPVPADRMPALMSTIDVLALPSRSTLDWKEQFGRVIVEAMAAGAEVVGSDSGEIPNVIDDPAMIFPEGDGEALAALLRRRVAALRDPQARAARREAMRDRAWQRYSDEACARAFADALRALIDR